MTNDLILDHDLDRQEHAARIRRVLPANLARTITNEQILAVLDADRQVREANGSVGA